MKAFVVASMALIASAGAALAADAGPTVTPGPFEPPPAYAKTKVYNWGGFYVGINGGGAFGDVNWTSSPDATSGSNHGSGGLFGGTAGYNLQAGDAMVLGLEGDIDWSGISGTVPQASVSPTGLTCSAAAGGAPNCELKLPWLATARLRIGYAFNTVLPYVTGGVAIARFNGDMVGAPLGTQEANNLGWTAGGGVEVAITGGLRAKVEYLYMDLNGFSCYVACAGTSANTLGAVSFNYTGSIVRAGLNYRFGGD